MGLPGQLHGKWGKNFRKGVKHVMKLRMLLTKIEDGHVNIKDKIARNDIRQRARQARGLLPINPNFLSEIYLRILNYRIEKAWTILMTKENGDYGKFTQLLDKLIQLLSSRSK